MSIDVGGGPASTSERRRRDRRRAWLLLAASAWTAFVWLTRLRIVLDGANDVPFRVVHGVLIVVSLGFAAVLGTIGVRMLAESRDR